MALERVDLVMLWCGVILGFSLGMIATSGLLPTTGLGSASPSLLCGTSADDWPHAWGSFCFLWAPLMRAAIQPVAAVVSGWLWSLLRLLIVHVGSSLPSIVDVFPWALVAVVSFSPDGTFVEGAFEVPFLIFLSLQGLVFVWALKKVLAAADAVDARRGRKSQRLRGKLRRMAKKALALKSRTIKDLDAQSNELGKSPARPRTATATEPEATKDKFLEVENTGRRIDHDEVQPRAESPAAGTLQGLQSAGVELGAPSVQDFGEIDDCRRELNMTLSMVDAAMAAKEAEMQEMHEAEMIKKDAVCGALVEALKAEMQALRRENEAASATIHEMDRTATHDLQRTTEKMNAAMRAREAKTQERHRGELGAKNAELQALRRANETASAAMHDASERELEAARRGLEVAEAELAEIRDSLEQEQAESATRLAALKTMMEEANVVINDTADRVARQEAADKEKMAGDAQKEAEIARLKAEVARLLELRVCPGATEEACAVVSPSGSSATSIASPCSSPSPAIGGSCFSTSSSSDGCNERGGGRKTKGEKKQASKLAAKRTRMPAGASAVKSAQG